MKLIDYPITDGWESKVLICMCVTISEAGRSSQPTHSFKVTWRSQRRRSTINSKIFPRSERTPSLLPDSSSPESNLLNFIFKPRSRHLSRYSSPLAQRSLTKKPGSKFLGSRPLTITHHQKVTRLLSFVRRLNTNNFSPLPQLPPNKPTSQTSKTLKTKESFKWLPQVNNPATLPIQ